MLLAPSSGARAAETAPAPGAKPPPLTVIAEVDGIPIRQDEWDRLALPYYQEVEARAGRKLNDEEKRLLQKNLLEELIRERLWLADARRRGMKVTDDAVDARMKQSAFFRTDGKTDEAKFLAFKRSPSSNYPELRAQVETGLMIEEYTRWMERRFGPRDPDLRKIFQERTSQATIRYLLMGPDAVSLEPEARRRQILAYYEAHPQEFQSPDSARIQYAKVPIEAAASSDSARDLAAPAALKAANDLLEAVHSGAPVETAAKVYGGLHESGWFRLGDPIRGLGRSENLTDAIRNTTPGEWVASPIRSGTSFVVVRLIERKPARLQTFRDVAGLAKRHADAELRDAVNDSLAREEIRLHPETYTVPRVAATILARGLAGFMDERAISRKDLDRELKRRRKAAGVPESDRAWADSVRATLPERMRAERRDGAAFRTLRDAAKELRSGSPDRVAARAGAGVESFELYRGQPPAAPMLVEGLVLDSVYALRPGDVFGPRFARDSVFVVRVDRLDPAFLPPYGELRTVARSNALLAQRQAQEQEAARYFAEHRDDYMTKPKWIFDYVLFRKVAAESVAVSDSAIAAYYHGHPLEFTAPGKARPRVILFRYKASDGPDAREKARQRALEARERIAKGEDFGAVAKEVSEDAQSAEQGGAIGELTRSALMKELGDVIFTIPVGEVSDPIEARSAFHLIRVDARTPEELRPLSDCRTEIHGVLGDPIADSLAFRAASRMVAAVAAGASFDSLAAAAGGAVRSAPMGVGEELANVGNFENVQTVIGGMKDGGVTPEPLAVAPGYLVARRVSEVAPERASFDAVRERVVNDYLATRRRAIADSLNPRIREALEKGADLDSIAVIYGGTRVSKAFGRSGPIPDFTRDPAIARDSTYIEKVFASRAGALLPPVTGATGTLYARVESLAIPPASEFAKRRDEVWREIVDQRVEAWTARLRSRATVTIRERGLRDLAAER
ncbi:MAG TPA: peptidyl-prolyl cis-trans isomerase [Candidatus Eisenbacteria bacterium]